MKKITGLLLTGILFLATGQAIAQGNRGDRGDRMAAMKEKMKTDLKLTDAQSDSIASINQSMMPQRRALFQDQSLSQDDRKMRMKALGDSTDSRVKSVLGDSLFTRYKDWQKANRPARMGGGGRNAGEGQ